MMDKWNKKCGTSFRGHWCVLHGVAKCNKKYAHHEEQISEVICVLHGKDCPCMWNSKYAHHEEQVSEVICVCSMETIAFMWMMAKCYKKYAHHEEQVSEVMCGCSMKRIAHVQMIMWNNKHAHHEEQVSEVICVCTLPMCKWPCEHRYAYHEEQVAEVNHWLLQCLAMCTSREHAWTGSVEGKVGLGA